MVSEVVVNGVMVWRDVVMVRFGRVGRERSLVSEVVRRKCLYLSVVLVERRVVGEGMVREGVVGERMVRERVDRKRMVGERMIGEGMVGEGVVVDRWVRGVSLLVRHDGGGRRFGVAMLDLLRACHL